MQPEVNIIDHIDRLKNLLRNTFGTQFKAYFEGNPDVPEPQYLPCVCIYEMNERPDDDATETDQNIHTVMIRVILNKRDDDGANMVDPEVDMTERKLRKMISGRDPATGLRATDTFLFALRTNLTLGDYVVGNVPYVEYGAVLDQNMKPITAEAHIQLTLTERVIIYNRR
jgi:hypothetical protein